MVYTSDLILPVAAVNIDLATSGLVALLNDKPSDFSSNEEKIDWTHFLCTYTRFVHLRTWLDLEPISRVRKEFVPQIGEAEKSIADFLDRKKELGFIRTQISKMKRYKRNVTARRMNLENNYCEGRPSAFEPGAIDATYPG